MRRNLIIAVCVSLGMIALSAMGCGKQSSGEGTKSDRPTMAYDFRDGAAHYYEEQKTCPVCGGQPIKEGVYATYQGKRIYFDKEECADKFESSPQEYIQKWQERIQKERQKQAEEMRRQSESGQ